MRIQITLIEPANYGRKPLWQATNGVKTVSFRCNDDGSDRLRREAAAALEECENEPEFA